MSSTASQSFKGTAIDPSVLPNDGMIHLRNEQRRKNDTASLLSVMKRKTPAYVFIP
jgi:hypothetical protein